MAVNRTSHGDVLPCARSLDDVLDAVQAGRPAGAHELACPHCRTAREGMATLAETTRAMAEEPVEPPAGLSEKIMSAVRAEVRRPGMVPLSTSGQGPVEVSEQAVAVLLRYAADKVSGVRARRCTVRLAGYDEGGSAELTVELSLALAYGTGPAEPTLAEVRRRVAETALARVGVRIETCDLLVEDVYQE